MAAGAHHRDDPFSGRVVLVSGGGRGIGRATALRFAELGATVHILSRTTSADDTAAAIRAQGGAAVAHRGSVTDECFCREVVTGIEAGEGGIDVLVNAAAVLGPSGRFTELGAAAFAETMATNFLGPCHLMRWALPGMERRSFGRVINFAGGGAAYAYASFTPYAVSKVALVRLTETIAEEIKVPGVTVNIIAPGAVDTDMLMEVRRRGGEVRTVVSMEEPLRLVLFLAGGDFGACQWPIHPRAGRLSRPELVRRPRHAEAASGRTPVTRVGFVGLGLIGARRLRIVRNLGCEIAFAVDPDPSRQAALTLEPHRFFVEPAAVRCESVDAIFVAVPHDLAFAAGKWALELGAAVLCEKPAGISVAEAQRLGAIAEAADAKFCAGFNYRFLPGIVRLQEFLRSGAFGEIQRVRMNIGHGGRPGMENEWKLKRSRAGGGVIIDPGIHLIDLVRYLIGEPAFVDGVLRRRFWQVDVEDSCALRLTCGKTDVTIDVGLTYWKNLFSVEVYGVDGMAQIDGRGGNYGEQSVEFTNRWFWNGDDRRMTVNFGKDDPSFERETRAFLDWVGGAPRGDVLSTIDDAIRGLAIVEEIYRRVPVTGY